MRIQPRQQVFDIWKALLKTSVDSRGSWQWGGIDGSNAISDAEQLLCLLYPATEIDSLALDRPDDTAEDVADVLEPLGDRRRVPWKIIQILGDYVERYTRDGEPVFHGGTYLRSCNGEPGAEVPVVDPARQELDVLDAYSMSVTLCLAALGFMNTYTQEVTLSPKIEKAIVALREAVSSRLTAAMIGLQRSFVVNWFGQSDPSWKHILAMVNQDEEYERHVADRLRRELKRIRIRLGTDMGVEVPKDEISGKEPELFECGWSWGIAKGAEPADARGRIASCDGLADSRPYLYFTVLALDGINDLRSPRTREMNLLNAEQRKLYERLNIQWDLTQRYWSTIARFGGRKWPLEDIPWRTSDGMESEYYSLLVSAVLVQDLINRQASDDDLTRTVEVFEELARRGRITKRVTLNDPATKLHVPGLVMPLVGTEGTMDQQHRLYWRVADFSTLMLKRAVQTASLSSNIVARDRLLQIAGAAMDHLTRRQLHSGSVSALWDDPFAVFPGEGRRKVDKPSWYMTERVVEGMVAAVNLYKMAPLRSPQVAARTLDLLTEADHLFNQVLLSTSVRDKSKRSPALTEIEQGLTRARDSIDEQPGTAYVLAADALLRLSGLTAASDDASRSQ